MCRLEPAVLMFAAHEPHLRTALGAVTATVQQRLTTADALVEWVDRLAPLRRSRDLRDLLSDVGDGAHSMAEVDLRKACRAYGVQPPQVPALADRQPRPAALHRCRVATG